MSGLSDQQSILLDAANESFAGMRAYHQSEIAHKKDAVHILTTILAANGALIAAGFGALQHRAVIEWWVMGAVALIVSISTVIFSATILKATLEKVAADSTRYQDFKRQSIRARTLLGMYAVQTTAYGVATVFEPPKESVGSDKTKGVLVTFFWMVLLFSVMGWLALVGTWFATTLSPG